MPETVPALVTGWVGQHCISSLLFYPGPLNTCIRRYHTKGLHCLFGHYLFNCDAEDEMAPLLR